MLGGGWLVDELLLVWARLFEMRKPYRGLQKNVNMTDIYGSKTSAAVRFVKALICASKDDTRNVTEPPR